MQNNSNIEILQAQLAEARAKMEALAGVTQNETVIQSLVIPPVNDVTGKPTQSSANAQIGYAALQTEQSNAYLAAQNLASMLNSGVQTFPAGVKTTDIPCVMYVKQIQNQTGNASMTTQWTTQNTQLYAYNALSVCAGINRLQTTGAAIPTAELDVHTPPIFFKSIRDNVVDLYGSNEQLSYANTDYTPHINAFFTLQNPTASPITITIPARLNAYTTYSKAGANIIIPAQTDTEINNGVSVSVTATNVFDISSTGNTTIRNLPITVPAFKTVIVHVYSSFKYITGASNLNICSTALRLENLDTLISATSLRANLNFMYNLKAMIEHDFLNLTTKPSQVTKIEDLFSIRADYGIPQISAADITTARAAAITAGLNYGSQFMWLNTTNNTVTPQITIPAYVDNATAKGAIGVGRFYRNTTSNVDAIVTA